MEEHMIRRKNILGGYLFILKGKYDIALKRLRDSSGLPEDGDQLPIHVYLMAQAYGYLDQPEQQIVLLECVADVSIKVSSRPLSGLLINYYLFTFAFRRCVKIRGTSPVGSHPYLPCKIDSLDACISSRN